MGKKCDVSKQRACSMKTSKKLGEKLECSPPCQVKPYPCSPCCPIGAYIPCGPPKCKCFLMQNCCRKPFCRTPSCCGPFPDSCTSICCPSASKCECCNPCCRCNNRSRCCMPSKCCEPKACACRCCCKPKACACRCCKPKVCACCYKLCAPVCRVYPQKCKPTCKCCSPCCCCRSQPCRKACIQYSPKCCMESCQRSPVGSLCCGCKTICLPRCCSDTASFPRKFGKTLTCSKSVELRGGKLYKGCDCDKKNGLQDRCLRYCCINNPKCRTEPASCHCSKFSCGKHSSIRYGKKKCISYTCYVCGPPMYPCMPCCPAICCCRRCTCCCQNKCENECQCCPTTCEVECCCQPCAEPCAPPMPCSPCPQPCPPCLEPCPPEAEPCCPPNPCPEPCIPCPEPCCPPMPCEPCPEPCYDTNSPSPENCCYPCVNNCGCDGGTQTNGSCYIEYGPPKCTGCQTNHY